MEAESLSDEDMGSGLQSAGLPHAGHTGAQGRPAGAAPTAWATNNAPGRFSNAFDRDELGLPEEVGIVQGASSPTEKKVPPKPTLKADDFGLDMSEVESAKSSPSVDMSFHTGHRQILEC